MKRIILLISVLLLSGCLNGNRDFETICTKEETSEGFIEKISYKIYSNSDNEITKIVETYNLKYSNDLGYQTFNAAKISLDSYSKTKNYNISTKKNTNNEYELELELDVKNLTDQQLEKYDIRRGYKNQLNVYRKEMKCN